MILIEYGADTWQDSTERFFCTFVECGVDGDEAYVYRLHDEGTFVGEFVALSSADSYARRALAVPRFTLDALDGRTFSAVSYGTPWNGWATPVVTRATLVRLVDALGNGDTGLVEFDAAGNATVQFDGNATTDSTADVVPVDANGNYNLGELGWTFDTVENDGE